MTKRAQGRWADAIFISNVMGLHVECVVGMQGQEVFEDKQIPAKRKTSSPKWGSMQSPILTVVAWAACRDSWPQRHQWLCQWQRSPPHLLLWRQWISTKTALIYIQCRVSAVNNTGGRCRAFTRLKAQPPVCQLIEVGILIFRCAFYYYYD